MSNSQCRLCASPTQTRFHLRLLGKHEVAFSECTCCVSLQTEAPYWLDEAYGDKNLSNLDTGAARRNIHNMAACYAIAKLFYLQNVIDIGGGDGLLCRMLRDLGINCYVKDKYATPIYAQGFTEQNFEQADLVIGFEVIEHFANPQADLEELFSYQAKAILLSTGIYAHQSEQWGYICPESGQHVFFYSQTALDWIAKKYQYSLIVNGDFILFLKQTSSFKRGIAKLLLSKLVCRLMRAWVVLLPAPGIEKDQLLQVKKSQAAQHLSQ
jgi:hypothetical protein